MKRQLLHHLIIVLLFVGASSSVLGGTGRVIKVLPHLLDLQGRHSLNPSLYERDAYQAYLRQHPEKRSTIRFDVQWKAKQNPAGSLKLRVEMRGIAAGNLPRELSIEAPVNRSKWFTTWSGVELKKQEYQELGEVTAWRVTLWEGDRLLGEQKSFLW